jgi:hypothetical protein
VNLCPMVRNPLPVALAVSTISCALPPIDYDGDGFRHHEALELVALSADRFNEATFDGIARAATLDDLARLVDDGAAHAPIDVDEAFVLEGAVVAGLSEPQPLLFSFHRLAADGTREVLFLPASGDSLAGSIQRSGWEGTLTESPVRRLRVADGVISPFGATLETGCLGSRYGQEGSDECCS